MKLVNYEFKARLRNETHIRAALGKIQARFVGTDHQVDTYFRVLRGRLKVREGRIENALIFYERPDARRARRSRIEMTFLPRRNPVKAILSAALEPLAVVDKRREIYFVGNVKIHLDRVRGLGKFVEVEAMRRSTGHGRRSKVVDGKIREQARKFLKIFAIRDGDLMATSYSDLVLNRLRHAARE